MPMTKCGHCGAPAYISEKEQEAGSEVYCSESCAHGKDEDYRPPIDYTHSGTPDQWNALWPPFQH